MLKTQPQETVRRRGEGSHFWLRVHLDSALSLTCCVTLNKLLNHFDTPVTLCKGESSDNSYFHKEM